MFPSTSCYALWKSYSNSHRGIPTQTFFPLPCFQQQFTQAVDSAAATATATTRTPQRPHQTLKVLNPNLPSFLLSAFRSVSKSQTSPVLLPHPSPTTPPATSSHHSTPVGGPRTSKPTEITSKLHTAPQTQLQNLSPSFQSSHADPPPSPCSGTGRTPQLGLALPLSLSLSFSPLHRVRIS